MIVTAENWSHVQEKLRQFGIKDTQYDSDGALQIVIAKNDERFEFSRETFEQFKNADLLRIGVRVKKQSK